MTPKVDACKDDKMNKPLVRLMWVRGHTTLVIGNTISNSTADLR